MRFNERNIANIGFNNVMQFVKRLRGEDNFLFSTDILFIQLTSFGVRKNFPLKKEFDLTLRKCLEAGLYEKFLSDEVLRYSDEKQLLLVESDDFHPLTLDDLIGTFGILIIGYTLSAIVFILEIIFKQISYQYSK
ncbi:uncharacterized protein LOC111638516 [Centruroides sculpturatus]|uniref:uncharacterized protein LOC111638516 n=1 Tax=Centruroides sculpturatus TaxID=218467 RepID=UPI000C6DC9C8|nr:uncharacterized protein LOC111638516 [Centruroides sculpturatus]